MKTLLLYSDLAVCVTGFVVQEQAATGQPLAGGYSGADPPQGLGVVTCSSVCTRCPAKNLLMQRSTFAAGCNFSTKGRRNRPPDTLHPARDVSWIELLGALAVLPPCSAVTRRARRLDGDISFHICFCNAGLDILGTESNRYPFFTGYATAERITSRLLRS